MIKVAIHLFVISLAQCVTLSAEAYSTLSLSLSRPL